MKRCAFPLVLRNSPNLMSKSHRVIRLRHDCSELMQSSGEITFLTSFRCWRQNVDLQSYSRSEQNSESIKNIIKIATWPSATSCFFLIKCDKTAWKWSTESRDALVLFSRCKKMCFFITINVTSSWFECCFSLKMRTVMQLYIIGTWNNPVILTLTPVDEETKTPVEYSLLYSVITRS